MSGYEKYKIDTEAWLSWFIQAAEDHGNYVEKDHEIDASAARTGRLKGKLRKQAREAGLLPLNRPAQQSAGAQHPPRRYLISTDEIQKQARFIATLQFTLTMPRVVWRCYRDCLNTRERYAARYAEDESSDPLDNEGHRYFNQVLATVHDLIKDRVRVQPVASAPKTQGQTALVAETLGTLYDKLKHADPTTDNFESEHDEVHANDTPGASSTGTIKAIYRPKLSKEEEARLQYICLLAEAGRAWYYSVKTWSGTSSYELAEDTQALEKQRIEESNGNDTKEALESKTEDLHEDTAADAINPDPKPSQKTLTDTAVAAIITEAAVAYMGQQEERYRRHTNEVSGIQSIQFELDPKDLMYLPFGTLSDVAKSRREVGQDAYRLPLRLLHARDPDTVDQDMEEKDTILVQYLMDLGLESAIRSHFWEKPDWMPQRDRNQPLLPTTVDEISRVLQSVNKQGSVGLQAGLAAELILALRVTDPQDRGLVPVQLSRRASNLGQQLIYIEEFLPSVREHELMDMLRTIHDWMSEWPVPEARRQRLAVATPETQRDLEGAIPISDDEHFLLSTNPAYDGKLRIAILILYEELGIDVVNTSPHVFSMCHLYNALAQTGRLQPGKERNMFQQISELHSQELFMGLTFPIDPQAMLSRMRVAMGTSLKAMQQRKQLLRHGRELKASEKRSKKTYRLQTSTTIQILREYLHGDITLLQALYRFDAEMQLGVPKRKQMSYIDELGVVPFLEKLQVYLEEALPHLQMDYLIAHSDCIIILREMDAKIAAEIGNIHSIPRPQEAEWHTGTWYSYIMVNETIRELIDVEKEEKRLRKAGKLGLEERLPTPLADIAAKAVREYLDERAADLRAERGE